MMMSSMLEKTMDQTMSLLRGSSPLKFQQSVSLRNLHDTILSTNRSIHTQKYRLMLRKCLNMLKQKSQDLHLTLTEQRECLLMIAHLSDAGEELDFVYPFVIKCIEDSKTLLDKHLGYTSLVLLSNKQQSGVYLAVNTLLKDISNHSNAVAYVSLTALASIIDVDLIPVFMPAIEKILKSSALVVKCKALTVLHVMVREGPEFFVNIWSIFVRAMCDRDPRIMSNSLPIIETLLKTSSPPQETKLHEKAVVILKQVEQGCLPIDMMYKGISGPWIQIRLLRIIQKLQMEYFSDSDFLQLEEIFTKMFARYQFSSVIQFAIIVESIYTIVIFHPKLDKLLNVVMDTFEKVLTSNDQNLFLTGTEILRSIVTIRPGFSRHYTDVLLHNLSDNCPSLLKVILQLTVDLACEDNSSSIVTVLVEKLSSISNLNFIRDILFCLLKIITKFPMDEKWLLENYLLLLAFMENEVDFSIIKKFVACLRSVSSEAIRNEASRLCSSLNLKYTQLQYCLILELLCFCNESIKDGDCRKAIEHILSNCCESSWIKTHSQDSIILSWNTIVMLATQHKIEIDLGKISDAGIILSSVAMQQAFAELSQLLKNSQLVIPNDFSCIDFVEDLPFLDEYTKANGTSEISNNSNCSAKAIQSSTELIPKKVTKFKTNPYSKSRFDNTKTPTENEIKVKKTFLDVKTTSKNTSSAWNKNNYIFENPANDNLHDSQ